MPLRVPCAAGGLDQFRPAATHRGLLPAAVEVAAYRIVTEALTNTARHAHARHTRVDLSVDGARLRLKVVDDGVGLAAQTDPRTTGVGLAAMAERAAELGGSCSVGAGEGCGTAVVAQLPLRVM